MPRKALDASDETVRITLRLTKRQVAEIDAHREEVDRSTYIRNLIDIRHLRPLMPTETPEPAAGHRHRFKRTGQPVSYAQGTPLYRHTCDCGEEKIDR